MRKGWTVLSTMGFMLGHKVAWANIGDSGGSNIPLVDFAIDLYGAVGGVGIPLICLLCLAAVCWNIMSGHSRIGPGISRVLLVVFLAAFGISGIAAMLGLDEAVALMG